MYNIPFYTPGERIRRLGEACEVIKRLWTETPANFDGKYYQLKNAYCEPKPVQKPYPPIVIGGGGEKLTLRIVAEYADIWNLPGGPTEMFQHKSAVLDERSVQLVINPNNLQETRDITRSFIKAGASHLILNLRAPYPGGIVQRLADEVAEPLKAE